MDVYRCTTLNTNSWSGMVATGDFKERMAYDANGNIVKYLRQGFGSNLPMDSLSYNYTYNSGKLVNNKLNYVTDQINGSTAHSTNYTDDIEDQAAGNYVYDRIGNLTADAKEGVTNITWNVYGKIKQVQRTATAANPVTNIKYTYDAGGNRISKQVTKSAADSVEYTWYVRDASGNIMTTYFAKGAPNGTIASTTASLLLTGQTMYGSSRLGVVNRNVDVKPLFTNGNLVNFTRGNKFFELTNHLGNVMETISDKKTGVTTNGTSIDYYYSEVITANDYYSFGSQMPGRQYKLNANSYRYGFNGKENDNDVKGEGNQQDYGMRIYDPRLGRFLSVDPLAKSYPWLSTYSYAENNPVNYIDLDGLETPVAPAQATPTLYEPAIYLPEGEGLIQRTARPLSLNPDYAPIPMPGNATGVYKVDENTVIVTGVNGNSWYESTTVPAFKPTRIDFSVPQGQFKVDLQQVVNFKNSIYSEHQTPLPVDQKPLTNYSPVNQTTNSKQSTSTQQSNNSGNIYLVRFGPPDDKEKLTTQSSAAEKNPDFGHGVSTKMKTKVGGNERAALLSEVSKVFKVKKTGKDPNHYTVILPKPITEEVTKKFNAIFKTKN